MTGRHALTVRQLEAECARLRVPLQTFGITDPDARRRTLVCRLDRARFDVGPYVGRHRTRTGELS